MLAIDFQHPKRCKCFGGKRHRGPKGLRIVVSSVQRSKGIEADLLFGSSLIQAAPATHLSGPALGAGPRLNEAEEISTGLPPTVMTMEVLNSQGTKMQKFNACTRQTGNNLRHTGVKAQPILRLGCRQGADDFSIQHLYSDRVTNDHGGTSIVGCFCLFHSRDPVHRNSIEGH